MVLWVLRAKAAKPVRFADETGHAALATNWHEVTYTTSLYETIVLFESDVPPSVDLARWVEQAYGAYDVHVGPAEDGTYHDLASGRMVTVTDGMARIASPGNAPV